MPLSDALVERVKVHEGLRLKPYRCTAGKLTIGYGRNLDDRGISEEEARRFLDWDLREANATVMAWLYEEVQRRGEGEVMALLEGEVMALLEGLGRVQLLERDFRAEWNVLVELAFWLGRGTLGQFKRLREAVLDWRFADAADELLWADEARTIPSKVHQQAPARTERLAAILREGRE